VLGVAVQIMTMVLLVGIGAHGAFREDALTEADAMAAADQEGTKV
jgi:hypothetical protein